jgi:P2-related tail formation protein
MLVEGGEKITYVFTYMHLYKTKPILTDSLPSLAWEIPMDGWGQIL